MKSLLVLVLKYHASSTKPDAMHFTTLPFKISLPGTIKVEFCVPAPSVTTPRFVLLEEVELLPLNCHCINTLSSSTVHL